MSGENFEWPLRNRVAAAIVLLCASTCSSASTSADTIHRRGGEDPVQGRVMAIDDAGIGITPESGGAAIVVPWDRVRKVDMTFRDTKLDRYMPVADDLWRARSRIERHDFALAEPILTRYFDQYRGRTNETALVVAQGLLRCRLARQANDQAVIPALETARLLRAKVSTRSYSHLPPLIDERTSLCTTLPPAFVVNGTLPSLQRELSDYSPHDDAVIAAMSGLYRNAVQQLIKMPVTETSLNTVAEHPGVQWLVTVISSNSADDRLRASARDRLAAGLASLNSWETPWARFAIGQSLLKDSGQGQQQAGLVSMIYVPAQFSTEQPYLAGLAMSVISDWLQANGQTESAAALRLEFQRTYPVHPALTAEPRNAKANGKNS